MTEPLMDSRRGETPPDDQLVDTSDEAWLHQQQDQRPSDAADSFLDWLDHTLARYYLADQKADVLANTAMLAEWQALYRAHRGAWQAKAGAFDQVQWHDALARVMGRMSGWRTARDSAIYAVMQPAANSSLG
ncbi:MAG: hypothetical protein LBV30_06560 [Propionibacteriaceae bacterium]|nr:hypothetical protein [Propionibacteriaceae bacterium]